MSENPYYRLREEDASKWTDGEVLAHLNGAGTPLERCRVGDGLYGFVDQNGEEFICMDDDDERAERVIVYLQRMGVPGWSKGPRT